MKIKASNLTWILFCIILVLNFSAFYLVNADQWHTDDLALLLEVSILVLWIMVQRDKGIMLKGYGFWIIAIFPCILAITSSIAANFYYNQPFFMGFRAQRHWLFALLMYFPLRYWMSQGKITLNQIESFIYKFCIIYLIIGTIQYLLADELIFVYVLNNRGYGTPKFYFDESILVLLFSIAYSRIMTKKTHKLINILICGWIIIFLLQITKYRTILLALVISMIVITTVYTHISWKKVFVLIAVVVIAVALLQTPLGQSLQNAYLGNDGSLNMRDVGREFYLKKLQGNYLFGCGFINTYWETAFDMGGVAQKIYYNDNGIFGILFYYGFFGVMWLIISNFLIIKYALHINRKTNDFSFLIFAGVNIIVLVTGLPNFLDNTLVSVIYLCLLEATYNKNQKCKRKM